MYIFYNLVLDTSVSEVHWESLRLEILRTMVRSQPVLFSFLQIAEMTRQA
jgi:hypothetical protein